MSFYVSNADAEREDIRDVYRSNRIGFNAERIPRKEKKRLLKEWTDARADVLSGATKWWELTEVGVDKSIG